MSGLPDFKIRMPTEAELFESCSRQYERVSPTFLDRWPPGLMDLSFPTKFIPIDPAQLMRLWHDEPRPIMEAVASEIAATLDEAMGWSRYFVRLNSRSPKDASQPQMPVTCSGKQAVEWLWCSERALDDCSMFLHAKKPMFICLREARHLHKEMEFRCFAKDGRVLGVSRYFYNEPPHEDFAGLASADIMGAAQRYYDAHLAEHFPTIVFDLYAPGQDRHETLIEINPYGLSDPCLFEGYADIEENGGFRWTVAP